MNQQHITGFTTYELKIGEFDHSDAGQMNITSTIIKTTNSLMATMIPLVLFYVLVKMRHW